MIKCPKCEGENQIGAIFCRGCGEKLDLDDIKPETVMDAAKKARGTKINWFSWIKNAILLVVLAALVLFFWRLFQAPSEYMEYEFADGDLTKAKARVENFERGIRTSLSADAINALATDYYGLGEDAMTAYLEKMEEEGQAGMVTASINVELLDDNRIRMTIYQKHNQKDFVKYYSVIEGKIDADESGLTFTPDKYAMGNNSFGFAGFLRETIVKRFQAQIGNAVTDDFDKLRRGIRKIEVKDGEVTITGEPKKKRVAPTKKPGTRRRRKR